MQIFTYGRVPKIWFLRIQRCQFEKLNSFWKDAEKEQNEAVQKRLVMKDFFDLNVEHQLNSMKKIEILFSWKISNFSYLGETIDSHRTENYRLEQSKQDIM